MHATLTARRTVPTIAHRSTSLPAMNRPLRRLLLALCVVALVPWAPAARAGAALDWMTTVEQATAKVPGLRADRAKAIAWLAAFNALNAVEPRYRPYAPSPAPLPAGALRPSDDAIVAAALYTALVVEPDADQALLVRRYRETLAGVKAAPERDAGVVLGQQAALMLMAARSADRLARVDAPAREAAIGVFVAPSYAKGPRSLTALTLAPFGVRSVQAFDPGPPPAPTSEAAMRELADVRANGALASATRSADQTAAALFWNSSEGSDFRPLFVAAIEARKLDALDTARVAALDALIGIDGSIVNSVQKEQYVHWRPETAIAGPFALERVAGWEPLVPAPPSPQYPSGGATGAGTLEVELPRLLGLAAPIEIQNGHTFQKRRWPDAAALADEMASSRVWAGAHFRSAIDAGRRVGRQVATEILDRQLLPR